MEKLLSDDNLLRAACITVVETVKRYCESSFYSQHHRLLAVLDSYSPDEYIEFARKNLKEKLSKM